MQKWPLSSLVGYLQLTSDDSKDESHSLGKSEK